MMRTSTWSPRTPVATTIGVSGSENTVAFSSSSASRCAAGRALNPSMAGSAVSSSSTRSYCSISDEAVRMTSDSGSESRRRRPESMPASTSSDSALRRMRVARWSRRNRFARVLGSSSDRSSESMNDSWRLRSTWSRRATLTNISAMDPRSAACSWATWTVVAFTALNAAARRPTSSDDVTGICGSSSEGLSPGTCTCSTRRGSSSRTSAAAAVRRRSGTTMVRETTTAKKKDSTAAPMAIPTVMMARWVCASIALVATLWPVLRTSVLTALRRPVWSVTALANAAGSTRANAALVPMLIVDRIVMKSAFGSA